jgi:F-type H+-transporting ATPase subunit delta
MRGASRDSTAAGRERLEALLSGRGVDASEVAEELFVVTDALADNPGLRRALTDPAREGTAKAGLIERLFARVCSGPTLDLLSGLVRDRWAASSDLTDAAESLAVSAVLFSAERADRLDAVEDELFRFSRIVAADTGLRDAFSRRSEGVDRKADLIRRLLGDKVAPETLRLAVQAATRPRGLRTEQALEACVNAAAERRRQLIAEVVSAVPLTERQRARLAAALERGYGRPVRLNLDLDPQVLGGLRIQIGGELIDGTLSGRLDTAGRELAG